MKSGRERGFGSLIAIVVVLLIAFLLMRTYLKTSIPKAPGAAPGDRTAVDTVRRQADRIEQQEKERQQALDAIAR